MQGRLSYTGALSGRLQPGTVVPAGTIEITENGTHDVSVYADAYVNVDTSAPEYMGETTVTPTKQTQTLATADTTVLEDITVEPIPAEYIDPSGSVALTSNGSHNVREYATAEVAVPLPEKYTGANIITPTRQAQTLQTIGKELESNITVNPIPSEYIVPAGDISITENGTVDVAQYARALVDVAGGGGASNVVTGSFLFDTNGAHTIELPYTGSGWPVAIAIFPKDGPYTYDTHLERFMLVSMLCIKGYAGTAPDYTQTAALNGAQIDAVYKSSASAASTQNVSMGTTNRMYNSNGTATPGQANALRILSANRLSVYMKKRTSTTSDYGFSTEVTYSYVVIYSE